MALVVQVFVPLLSVIEDGLPGSRYRGELGELREL
jgi:hypothetical protein